MPTIDGPIDPFQIDELHAAAIAADRANKQMLDYAHHLLNGKEMQSALLTPKSYDLATRTLNSALKRRARTSKDNLKKYVPADRAVLRATAWRQAVLWRLKTSRPHWLPTEELRQSALASASASGVIESRREYKNAPAAHRAATMRYRDTVTVELPTAKRAEEQARHVRDAAAREHDKSIAAIAEFRRQMQQCREELGMLYTRRMRATYPMEIRMGLHHAKIQKNVTKEALFDATVAWRMARNEVRRLTNLKIRQEASLLATGSK